MLRILNIPRGKELTLAFIENIRIHFNNEDKVDYKIILINDFDCLKIKFYTN